jgi:hypothetical protein
MISSVKIKSNKRKKMNLVLAPRKIASFENKINFHDHFMYCNYNE